MPSRKTIYQLIVLLLISNVTLVLPGYTEDYFDPLMLEGKGDGGELKGFSKSEFIENKIYLVDIYVNDEINQSGKYLFILNKNGKLEPLFNAQQIKLLGISSQYLPQQSEKKELLLSEVIPLAIIKSDLANQKVIISIPQIYLPVNDKESLLKRASPGIPGILTTYYLTGSTSGYNSNNQDNQFLRLSNQANFKLWRLKSFSEWDNGNGQSHWNNIQTFVERPLVDIKGNLDIGQISSTNNIFDSVNYNGISLNSNDSMSPDNMNNFSPEIRGIAKTNSQILIKQNGSIIYETHVSPGPFIITDYSASSSGGTLDVEITSSDGAVTHQFIDFASVPFLQKVNKLKYELNVGKYRNISDDTQEDNPDFTQLSFFYGLPASLTLYVGNIYSNAYKANSLGFGYDANVFGAFSLDYTGTDSISEQESGHRIRLNYSKFLVSAQTNFSMSFSQYSFGYLDFDDTMQFGNSSDSQDLSLQYYPMCNINASLNKNLGEFGSMNINFNKTTYWDTQEKQDDIQMAFNSNIGFVSYSISYGIIHSEDSSDKQISLNFSIPLGKLIPNANASYNIVNTKDGVSQRVNFSGLANKNSDLSYYVNATKNSNTSSVDSGIFYYGEDANLSSSISHDNNQTQVAYSLNGSVLIHENGVTLGQPSEGSTGLVHVTNIDNAKGITVENEPGVKTDSEGFALVPNLRNYDYNQIGLNQSSMNKNTSVERPVLNAVPATGSFIEYDYHASEGRKIQFQIRGRDIPVGAIAHEGDNMSYVAMNNILYFPSLPDLGVIHIVWGDNDENKCSFKYNLNTYQIKKDPIIYKITSLCLGDL